MSCFWLRYGQSDYHCSTIYPNCCPDGLGLPLLLIVFPTKSENRLFLIPLLCTWASWFTLFVISLLSVSFVTACFPQVLHLEGDVFVKAKLMHLLFTGGVIYPLNSREKTNVLYVYCTRLFRAAKCFFVFFSPPFKLPPLSVRYSMCLCVTVTVKLWHWQGFVLGLRDLWSGTSTCFLIPLWQKRVTRFSMCRSNATHRFTLKN